MKRLSWFKVNWMKIIKCKYSRCYTDTARVMWAVQEKQERRWPLEMIKPDLESGTHLYRQLQDLRQVTWPLGIAVSGLRPPWIQIPGCDFMTLVILGKLLNDMPQFPQLWSGGDNSTPLTGLSRTWVLRQSLIHASCQWLPASSTHLVEHLILARHVIW